MRQLAQGGQDHLGIACLQTNAKLLPGVPDNLGPLPRFGTMGPRPHKGYGLLPRPPPRLESEWHELASGRWVALALVVHGVGSGEAVLVRPGPLTRLRAAVCAGNRGIKENGVTRNIVTSCNV